MAVAADHFYVIGGTLPSDAPSYVVRQADTDLLESLRRGEFCYVLNTRQMGKSSLMIRTANRLRADGVAIAILDLTAVGQNLTPEQWYDGLLTLLGDQLHLEDRLEEFWLDNRQLGPMQRWMEALRQVVLPALDERAHRAALPRTEREDTTRTSLVIFIDEIDAVRSLPFSADEFFAGIRECYNRRTQNPEFDRLTFCLLGVATPADLITETRMSPFNIGRRIVVTDFTQDEAAPLAQGMAGGHAVLNRVLYWTSGHPYMTQRLCQAIADDPNATTPAGVDRLCDRLFLSKSARESDDNLAFVRNRLLRSEVDLAGLLDLYTQIRGGRLVKDDETNPMIPILRLSGIVRVVEGRLQIRNRIYDQVFDREWVRSHMPDAEIRRQRTAYLRGIFRAAGVATAALTIVGLLAIFAFKSAKQAIADRRIADKASLASKQAQHESEINAANATRETQKAQVAQRQAVANARQAQQSAADAKKEAIRADKSEKSVLAADRRIKDLNAQIRSALGERQKALNQAIDSRQKANESAGHANGLLYIANMNLAQQAYDNNNIDRVLELLHETDKGASHPFEWGYWQRQCHLDLWTLRGIDNRVSTVAYLPDNRQIVTCGPNGIMRLSDVLNRRIRPLPGPYPPVVSFAVSADGRHLVTAHQEKSVRVWDLRNDRFVLLPPQDGPILAVALAPDGSRVVTDTGLPGKPCQLRLWDAQNGQLLKTFTGDDYPVHSLAYAPNGAMIAAGSPDKIVHVWDAKTGAEVHTLKGHTGPVTCVAFSPDSARIASGSSDATFRIWDLNAELPADMEPLEVNAHPMGVGAVAFSSDGAWLATGGFDNVAKIWDATTGQRLLQLKGHTQPVTSVCFSKDGASLVTSSLDRTARVWETTRDRNTLTLRTPPLSGHAGQFNALAVAQKGPAQDPEAVTIVTGNSDGTAREWNVVTKRDMATLTTQKVPITAVAYASNDQRIAIGTDDGNVLLTQSGPRPRRTADSLHVGSNAISSLAFSPNDRYLVVAMGSQSDMTDTTATIWDLTTKKSVRTLVGHTRAILSVAYSPDGKFIATGGLDNTIHLWDTATGRSLYTLVNSTEPEPSPMVTSVAFSTVGDKLVSATGDVTSSGDNTAKVWDVKTGKRLMILSGHANSLTCAAFSPDGSRIVTGSKDKTARLWDVATGREVLTLKGHDNVVTAVAFTPNGDRIITAGADDTIKVWERLTDKEIADEQRNGPTDIAKIDAAERQQTQEIRRAGLRPFAFLKGSAKQIDLSAFYNAKLTQTWHSPAEVPGNDLASLPSGLQTLADVPFDIRGIVQLNGTQFGAAGPHYPDKVTGIPVGRPVKNLAFLIGTAWTEKDGVVIGQFTLHYANGQTRIIPLIYGSNVRDWWQDAPVTGYAAVAWAGMNQASEKDQRTLHLYRIIRLNPILNAPIQTIDFVSTLTASAPFLIALTVD